MRLSVGGFHFCFAGDKFARIWQYSLVALVKLVVGYLALLGQSQPKAQSQKERRSRSWMAIVDPVILETVTQYMSSSSK